MMSSARKLIEHNIDEVYLDSTETHYDVYGNIRLGSKIYLEVHCSGAQGDKLFITWMFADSIGDSDDNYDDENFAVNMYRFFEFVIPVSDVYVSFRIPIEACHRCIKLLFRNDGSNPISFWYKIIYEEDVDVIEVI